jgi:D-alanyl-D-alanine carboxypeptidase/D-alanyl-D-alanine-endopeptidase (penicillin-binding protein 4)
VRPRRLVLTFVAATLGAALLAPSAGAAPAPVGPAPSFPSTVRPVTVASASALVARMTRLIPARVAAAKALRGRHAALVLDPATGVTIWSTGAGTPMRGASTTKLNTAVTTLAVLGTATRFPTRVVAGRNSHEVVLVAGGDPMLTSAQLSSLAAATAARIASTLPPAPAVRPAAPAKLRIAVTVDDTLYGPATLASGWPSDYTPVVVSPVRPLVRDLRHSSDTSADAAKYFAGRLSTALVAALKARTDLAPYTRYTGRLTAPAGATELARFRGNTSGAALAHMLVVSDNDTAERLFRDNAVALGRPGTWAGAAAAEMATLTRLGVDVRGYSIHDGSGVSRNDRVTARGLVSLLRLAISPSHPELAPLRGYLPVAGVSGTLASRYRSKPTRCAAGRVFAKTGTLHDAIGLAGYARGSDGRLRLFAFLDVPRSGYSQGATRAAVDLVPTTMTGCY